MAVEDRIELFVTRQRTAIVVSLVFVGALCLLGAGYVYLTPTTETVSEETTVQTVESDVVSSAVVTGNTTLYDPGETLRNRSVYFVPISPNLTLTTRTVVPPDRSVNVSQRLRIETVALRDGRAFYQQERTLIDRNTTVSDGTVSTETTLNVSAIRQSLRQQQAEVGTVGRFQLRILLNVSYDTGTYDDSLSASVPFVLNGDAYYLDGEISAERTHSTTVTEQVRRPPTPLEYAGLGVLGLVLLGLSAVVARVARQSDPDRLRVNIVHDRHEEWISRGEFPTDSEKQYISIVALEDLVDVAIDSSRRVIFDPEIDTYAVIDGDEIYYYTHNRDDTDPWLDL